jgi:hypothetical protein
VDERERNVVKRRIKETHFLKVKTLEEFDVETASHIPSSRLRKLAEGEYVGRTEPVIFLVHQNRRAFPLGSSMEPGPPARIVATGMERRRKGFPYRHNSGRSLPTHRS